MNVSSQIYSNLSDNLLITYVNQLFPSPTLQSDAVNKHVFDKQPSNFVHYVRKITCLALLPVILPTSSGNYRRYNFQTFSSISGNVEFLENLQP